MNNDKAQFQRRTSLVPKTFNQAMIDQFKSEIRNALNDSKDILFTQKSYSIFESILQYFPFGNCKNIKHIILSPLMFKNIINEEKELTIKILFLIVSFLSINDSFKSSFFETQEEVLVLKLIKKLYVNKLIELEGIELFITMGIDCSLYSKTLIKPLLNPNLLNFVISLFIKIIKRDDIIFINKETFAKNILQYIQSNIFINSNNSNILKKHKDFLKLLSITNLQSLNNSNVDQLIFNILLKIYSNSNYDVLNSYFLFNCKKAYLNIKNKSIQKLQKEMNKLLSQIRLISKLVKDSKIDKETIRTGFIFNDSQTNGLEITEFASNIKEFTVLFSFCQESQSNSIEAPLLSFCLSDKEVSKASANDRNAFSIFIKDSRLGIQFDKTSFMMKQGEIKLNKTYLILISNSRNWRGVSSTIEIGINNSFEKVEIKGKCEKVDLLTIGHLIKNNIQTNFKGKIGPILIYDQLLEEKTKTSFSLLYNQYEKIAFNSATNYSFDEKDKYQLIDNDSAKAIPLFQTKNVLEALKLIIHPSIVLNAFKLRKHYKYYDHNEYTKSKKANNIYAKHYKFKSVPIPESFGSYPFITYKCMDQFLKNEGINFLILNIEYYYTLIRSIDKEKSIELITTIFDSLELILELIYLIMIQDIKQKQNSLKEIDNTESNDPNANTILNNNHEKLMFSFVKLLSLIGDNHKLTDRNISILEKFKTFLNYNELIPLPFKNKYSSFILDPCFYQGANRSTLVKLLPREDEVIANQYNNSQDFFTKIYKILEFTSYLINDKEYKELLQSIFGACEMTNLIIIISMFAKYTDNIEVIELLVESIYLRKEPAQAQDKIIEIKKEVSNKKANKAFTAQDEKSLSIQLENLNEAKIILTKQMIHLLSKINTKTNKSNYTQALILSLIIEDGVFEYKDEEDKDAIPNSNQMLIYPILKKFNASDHIMKCLFLTYTNNKRESKANIMKGIEEFENIDCTEYFNQPFRKKHKDFLINIVIYLSGIMKTYGSFFLIYAKKIYELFLALIKTIDIKGDKPKTKMCWFIHIFESRQLCTNFFEAYSQKLGFSTVNEFLRGITKSLIKLHPNPFIYSFYEKIINKNNEEAHRIFNHFSFKTIAIEVTDQFILESNLQLYSLMLRSLIDSNIIPLPLEEAVRAFVQYLIESHNIFNNTLISYIKEDKMVLLEVIIDIMSKLSKDTLNIIKEFIYDKESKKTIIFEFDKRNEQRLKAKDKENKREIESTSLVVKILERYSNDKKWLEEQGLLTVLMQEKEEVEQKLKGLVLTVKSKSLNNTNNDKSNSLEPDGKLSNSFIKCSNCIPDDDNDHWEVIHNKHLIDQNSQSNNSILNQIALNKQYNTSSLFGFYDVGITNAVICTKRDLILRSFAIHFLDIYFEDDQFHLLCSNYNTYINSLDKEDQKTKEKIYKKPYPLILPIPTKFRNYSSCCNFTPRIFFKKDLGFYTSQHISISHPYYTPFPSKKELKTYHNLITDLDSPFKSKFFNLKTCAFECKAELIMVKYTTTGTLYLLSNCLLFISSANNKEYKEDRKTYEYVNSNSVNDIIQIDKEVIMLLNKVEEVIARRFLYQYVAIEVFMKNGKSYFFNLHQDCSIKKNTDEGKNGLLDHLLQLKKFRVIVNPKNEFKIKDYVTQWKKNLLSNYEFILQLNKYSGRTYNDLNQYPIMPWVYLFTTNDNVVSAKQTKEEEEKKKKALDQSNRDDSSKSSFISSNKEIDTENKPDIAKQFSLYEKLKKFQRDFQYPISIQNIGNQKRVEKKYKESLRVESKKSHIAHFRLFYSTSGYIIFYLFRQNPFTQIQIIFQSGKFDSPGRQFNSVAGLVTLLNSNLDNRELIPEIFSSFEYTLNLNYCYYGIKPSCNELIHHLDKPTEISSLAQLPYLQMRLLNKDQTKQKIHDWIDNIFGYYQLKTNNNNRLNLFDKYTYAQLVNIQAKKAKYLQMEEAKEMKPNEGIDKLRCKADRIISFGQAADKLFTEPFKKWEVYDGKENTDDDFSKVGNLMGNLNVLWKETISKESRVIYVNLTSNEELIYTLVIEANDFYNSIKVFRNKNEFSKAETIYINKMKLFKIKMDNTHNTKNYLLRYPIKYALFDIKSCNNDNYFFFTCRHMDNSIKIYNSKGLVSSYITDSFVSTLYRLNNLGFISGSRNGRLIHWLITNNNDSIVLNQKRSVYAHNGMITGIAYIKQHHILITIGDDRNLFIRKQDTFELMIKISTKNESEYFTDFAFSHFNQIWTLTLDTSKINKERKCLFLSAYSVNGVCFYTSAFNSFNGLCVNSNGIVITSLFDVPSISLYSLEWFYKSSKPFPYLNLQPHDINLKSIFVDYRLGDDLFLANFSYFNVSNTFYFILGNKAFRIAYDNQSNEYEWFHDQEIKGTRSSQKFNLGF